MCLHLSCILRRMKIQKGRNSRSRAGFTLIELLVVIAIIGILAAIVIASLGSARAKGRDARRQSDIKQIQLALELYNDTNNGYPVVAGPITSIDLSATNWPSAFTSALAPAYISVLLTDPVNTSPQIYTYVSTDGAGSVCTTGPCGGYRLKAVLEAGTVTGGLTDNVAGVDCTVAAAFCASN